MIHYDSKSLCISLRNIKVLIRERHIWVGILFALPSAILAFALKTYDEEMERPWFRDRVMEDAVYSAVNVFASFVVIFRMECAYARFFEACEKVYNISGNMLDLFSLLIAFCRSSKADESAIRDFQQTLVRLMSLLNASVFIELREKRGKYADTSDFEVLDLDGLDEDTLGVLRGGMYTPEEIVQMCFQWVQALIVDNMQKKVLDVPPPILTRVYQESGAGMVKFHEGLNVVLVPYPFPFTTTTEVLLIIQSCTLPIVIIEWTGYRACASGFCFIMIFSLWFFNMVAGELENPFIGTVHSLDMHRMQKAHNSKLLQILSREAKSPPGLAPEEMKGVDDPQMMSAIRRTKFGALLKKAAKAKEEETQPKGGGGDAKAA